ncbi:MAG: hypothetical protein WCJ28_07725, partial [Actinomycetota bacterium]
MADAYETMEDLIKAHRPRLERVALKLNRGIPEIGKELWEYLKGLPRSLSQQERAEALETAFKKVEVEAMRGERRKTRSGTTAVERYERILADRAEDVEKALRRKNVKQIDRAASMAGAALADVEKAIQAESEAEGASAEDTTKAMEEARAPVRELFRRAKEAVLQAAMDKWERTAQAALEDAKVLVEMAPDEQTRGLVKETLDQQIQEFSEGTRQLDALLAEGAAEGLAGHAQYEEICTEIRAEQLQMARAVKQLCDLSRVLFGDEDTAASGQESVSSQASSPVS